MRSIGVLLGALAVVGALPQRRVVKRQVDELRDNYDFVVVGGGTAGLTVADRLSEAFPERMLLVFLFLRFFNFLLPCALTPSNSLGAKKDEKINKQTPRQHPRDRIRHRRGGGRHL